MKKGEIIHLHRILAAMKKFFQEKGIANDSNFTKYYELEIGPNQLHRSTEEHKKAVFILAKELALSTQSATRQR